MDDDKAKEQALRLPGVGKCAHCGAITPKTHLALGLCMVCR